MTHSSHSKEANIQKAIERFYRLETGQESGVEYFIEDCVGKIRYALLDTGVTTAALDPSGHHTEEQMEKRLTQAAARAYRKTATDEISRLKNAKTYSSGAEIDCISERVMRLLGKASHLVPNRKEDRRLRRRKDRATAGAFIKYARQLFYEIQTTDLAYSFSEIHEKVQDIHYFLRRGGGQLKHLDANHKSTSEEMQVFLDTVTAALCLKSAKHRLGDLTMRAPHLHPVAVEKRAGEICTLFRQAASVDRTAALRGTKRAEEIMLVRRITGHAVRSLSHARVGEMN